MPVPNAVAIHLITLADIVTSNLYAYCRSETSPPFKVPSITGDGGLEGLGFSPPSFTHGSPTSLLLQRTHESHSDMKTHKHFSSDVKGRYLGFPLTAWGAFQGPMPPVTVVSLFWLLLVHAFPSLLTRKTWSYTSCGAVPRTRVLRQVYPRWKNPDCRLAIY